MKIESYQNAMDYLYQKLPMFQRVGVVAYKEDLSNTLALCKALGDPEKKIKSIHVAGTNGKGSSSHMIAAILQTAGYKTGLYTSPHLKEFTERIKINSQEISKEFVVDFVNRIKTDIEKIQPSFFEMTVAMAFDYFVKQQVDIAVIEVGLGGRLDSTNVITPDVSLITNISWDHTDLLGHSLLKIAAEKAGIIKKNIPIVISESQDEVKSVFINKAKEMESKIVWASDQYKIKKTDTHKFIVTHDNKITAYELELKGNYQEKNLAGVLATINELKKKNFLIEDHHIEEGLKKTIQLTGLKGRWQKLADKPLMICDTGHNEAGVREVLNQLSQQSFHQLHIVWGAVKDKDITNVLKLLPITAQYYFCEAKIPRAMPAEQLKNEATKFGLIGDVVPDVNDAIACAKNNASENDLIFIGGSTFVVAEIFNL